MSEVSNQPDYPTAISFLSPTGQLFVWKSWATLTSSSSASNQTTAGLPGGSQDAYISGWINEFNVNFDILSDPTVATVATTGIYEAIKFDNAIRESNQLSKKNWTMKIYYNPYTETTTPTQKTHNPSTWVGKISSFIWTAALGEQLGKVTCDLSFFYDDT